MVIRFTDNILENIEGTGFVVRRRVPRTTQIVACFIIAFILICMAYILSELWKTKPVFTFTLIVVISLLCWGTFRIITATRRLVMSSEYQNAMFASAAQIGARFCLVAHKSGSIVYIDPGFQAIFPHFVTGDSRTVTSLLTYANVPEHLARKIVSIMQKNSSETIMLPITGTDNNSIDIFVNIDPIARPKGYFIIRGRDYVRKREEDAETIREKQMMYDHYQLLGKSLYSLPGGIVIAGSKEEIIFANHEMEQIIGYKTEEMVRSGMMLEDILENYNPINAGKAFEGNVTLLKNNNREQTVKIKQVPLLDKDSKVIGVRIQLIDYSS